MNPRVWLLATLSVVAFACKPDTVADDGEDAGGSAGDTAGDTAGSSSDSGSDGGEVDYRVEVIIDDNGVPHVYGRTDADAFYGAGYQMAADRLFHMEMTRRRAYGTLAEVLGEKGFDDDELSRLFDFRGWGEKHAAKMRAEAPELEELLDAWAAGVNKRIEEVAAGEAPLPYELGPGEYDFVPEPWKLEDVMTIATMTGFGNDLTFDAEIFVSIAFKLAAEALDKVAIYRPARDTFTSAYGDGMHAPPAPALQSTPPKSEPASLAAISPEDVATTMHFINRLHRMRTGMGSNNWAVAGEHTASGRPIVAGDPHLDWYTPGIFYAQHINSADQDGALDVAGFSFVGTPGISVGHTRGVIWTPTTAFADTMDVWAVQRPDGGDMVMVGGEERTITSHEEIVIVRGSGDPVGEGAPRSVLVETVEGGGVILPASLVPIPVGEEGDVLMMNWAGFVPSSFKNLLDFNRVDNIDDYEAAVADFGANFNFVAADAGGITHTVGTRVPDRTVVPGNVPWKVMDGDDPKTLWSGDFLPPDELPGSRGGERGFVCTANNDPFGFSEDGTLDNDPWYFGAYFAPGWRARRIESELERLTAEGGITVEDMQALQSDTHSNIADDLIPILEEAWGEVGTDMTLAEFEDDEALATLADMLIAWDRRYDTEQGVGLAFFAYQHFVTQRAIGDDIMLLFQQAMEMQPVFVTKIAVNTMRGLFPMGDDVLQEGRYWVALAALRDTADYLETQFGSVDGDYKMSDVKFSHFDGATGIGIDRGKFPTPGADDTINVAANHNFFSPTGGVDEELLSKHGSIFRQITTFTDDGTPQMWFNMPLGNSSDPDSPHNTDLMDDWLHAGYRRMWFSRDEVEAHEETRYQLLPDDPAADG